MDAEEVEMLRRDAEALARALERERFRHVAGIEPEPALGAIFREHARAAHKDTVAALRDKGEARLAAVVAELRAERTAAEAEEAWRAAESEARGRGPDGLTGLDAAQRGQLDERKRARRLELGRAVEEAAEAAAGPREAAAEQRAKARAELGLTSERGALAAAETILAATGDAYADVLAWTVRRELELAPAPQGDLARADLLHLLALHPLDGLFPAGMLALAAGRVLARLGLALGDAQVDDERRARKWPGAHALGARVSLGRRGGAADWLDLFRAAGVALARGRAEAPLEAADPAVPHALGALLQRLFLDPVFLARELEVEKRRARDVARALALRLAFELRCRAAALPAAVELEEGRAGEAFREAHRARLSAAALAPWPAALASRDADAGRLAAELRGAGAAERLRALLRERCDEDWWRNPRAKELLLPLLAGAAFPWAQDDAPPPAAAAEALAAAL